MAASPVDSIHVVPTEFRDNIAEGLGFRGFWPRGASGGFLAAGTEFQHMILHFRDSYFASTASGVTFLDQLYSFATFWQDSDEALARL